MVLVEENTHIWVIFSFRDILPKNYSINKT